MLRIAHCKLSFNVPFYITSWYKQTKSIDTTSFSNDNNDMIQTNKIKNIMKLKCCKSKEFQNLPSSSQAKSEGKLLNTAKKQYSIQDLLRLIHSTNKSQTLAEDNNFARNALSPKFPTRNKEVKYFKIRQTKTKAHDAQHDYSQCNLTANCRCCCSSRYRIDWLILKSRL